MKKICDDLIDYIDKVINSDTDLDAHFDVLQAQMNANKVKSNQIQVQVADDTENTQFTTLEEGENVSIVPVQITCYVVGNLKYQGEDVSAIKGSLIVGDKIKSMFQKNVIRKQIPNIIRCVRTSTSPALPLSSGTLTYTTAIRYELQITK